MILHIVPTYDVPQCGIAGYARHLIAGLKAVCEEEQVMLAGGFASMRQALLTHQPRVCHVQFEYGFCSPERLHLLSEYCNALGVRLVITYHTLAQSPHNLVEAVKLTHTPLRISRHYGSFDNIFSPIPKVAPASTWPTDLPELTDSKVRYLFFGQAHPHKGLLETLITFRGKEQQLICLVSKPVSGSTWYHDRCLALAKTMSNVIWCPSFLDDSQVVLVANHCSVALFPYTEYGGIGTSAAIRLLLNSNVPIYCSNSSHFADLNRAYKPEISFLTSFTNITQVPILKEINVAARAAFVEEHSFENSARTHLSLHYA